MCEVRNQSIESLNCWIEENRGIINPIFDEDNLQVNTAMLNGGRQILCIHQDLKNAIIQVVKDNINNEEWQGFLYIMGKFIKENNDEEIFFPLYVGKTLKIGRSHPISSNINNIENNHSAFARWGHGNYWHIGQLSNSLFDQTQKPSCRHDNWAKELFRNPINQAVLKQKVYLAIINWDINCNSPSGLHKCLCHLEVEVIKLAKRGNPDLLNIHGLWEVL